MTVNPVNDAPIITSTAPDGNVELGSSFEYQVSASDVDDASLSYSLSGNPAGMTVFDKVWPYFCQDAVVR